MKKLRNSLQNKAFKLRNTLLQKSFFLQIKTQNICCDAKFDYEYIYVVSMPRGKAFCVIYYNLSAKKQLNFLQLKEVWFNNIPKIKTDIFS